MLSYLSAECQLDIVAFSGAIVIRRVAQQEKHSSSVLLNIKMPEPLRRHWPVLSGSIVVEVQKTSFVWCGLCELLVVASTCLWQRDISSRSLSCCITLQLWYNPSLTSFRCAWPLSVYCSKVGDRRELCFTWIHVVGNIVQSGLYATSVSLRVMRDQPSMPRREANAAECLVRF